VLRQGRACGDAADSSEHAGHDPNVKRPYLYDPARPRRCSTASATRIATATAIRELPDCSRWCSSTHNDPSEISRQFNELWKKSMDAIGIKIEFVLQKWPDTLKAAKNGRS
jgi:hypothetical protein